MQVLSDIFNTLHDGTLESVISKADGSLRLKVGCTYLAVLQQSNHEYFIISIDKVKRFEFQYWGGDAVTDFAKIESEGLDIYSSEIHNEIVSVICYIGTAHGEPSNGGTLKISASFRALFTISLQPICPLSSMIPGMGGQPP